MPRTFSSLLVPVVFSTKDRVPDLSPELSARLFPYMGGIVKESKAAPLIINSPADHLHALASISPATSVADLLRVLKTDSSRWVHEQFPERKLFAWQFRALTPLAGLS